MKIKDVDLVGLTRVDFFGKSQWLRVENNGDFPTDDEYVWVKDHPTMHTIMSHSKMTEKLHLKGEDPLFRTKFCGNTLEVEYADKELNMS